MIGLRIIGTGMFADIHALAISQIRNTGLIRVINRTKSKGEIFGHKHHCKIYDSLEDMVGDNVIQIVCICMLRVRIGGAAIACMKPEKHCLNGEPLEINAGRYDKFTHVGRKYDARASVVFPSKFCEPDRKLKRAIEEKRFRNLVMGYVYIKWFRTREYYASAGTSIGFRGRQQQMEDMIRAIETGSELFIPIEEGRKSVAIA